MSSRELGSQGQHEEVGAIPWGEGRAVGMMRKAKQEETFWGEKLIGGKVIGNGMMKPESHVPSPSRRAFEEVRALDEEYFQVKMVNFIFEILSLK